MADERKLNWQPAPKKLNWQPATQPAELPVEQPVPADVAPVDDGYSLYDAAKDFEKGSQWVGRGAANLLGFPVDITTAALNAGLGMGELLGLPTTARITEPVLGSEWIKDLAGQGYEAVGGEPIPDEDLSTLQRIVGRGVELGTEAMGGGIGLSKTIGREVGDGIIRGLSRPYEKNAARVIAGDTAAGAGSGIGLGGYEEMVPEERQGPFGALLAAILGGTGGATAKAVAEGGTKAAVNATKSTFGQNYDPLVSIDQLTGHRPVMSEVEQAARIAQGEAVNPAVAAQEISEQTADFDQFAPRGTQPTVGPLSGDTGLAVLENTLRTKNSVPFTERDINVSTQARSMLDDAAPRGAEGRDFTDFADEQVRSRVATIDQEAAKAKQDPANNAGMNDPLGDYRGKGPEASRAIDEQFRAKRDAERKRKNELFEDPELLNAPVDSRRIYEAANELESSVGVVGDEASLPQSIIANIKKLEIRDEKGKIVDLEPMTYADVQDLRAQTSQAIREAIAASGRGDSGSGPRVANLRKLRATLDDYIEDLAAGEGGPAEKATAALGNYKDNYAPRFKEGQSGKFARDIDADQYGTRTRPEDTAERFLGKNKGDDVESLDRAIGLKDDNAANARTFLLDKLAKTNAYDTATGKFRPEALSKWVQSNRETIQRVPGMAEELRGVLDKARKGQQASGEIAERLRQIDTEAAAKRREVEKGPLGLSAGKSPRNAVSAVFNSGDPERNMQTLVEEVAGDEKARNGLKAAIVEHLIDNNTTTALQKTRDASRPVSFAKLENTFNDHADTLAQVFSPEEMNKLRQVHKLLRPMGKLALRGTSGSDTSEKSKQVFRVLEAGLKARYGVLKGGGILRTIRVALEALPNNKQAVDRLVERMMFDPDLAQHLLTKELKDVGTPEWNSKLSKLIAVTEAGKEVGDDD